MLDNAMLRSLNTVLMLRLLSSDNVKSILMLSNHLFLLILIMSAYKIVFAGDPTTLKVTGVVQTDNGPLKTPPLKDDKEFTMVSITMPHYS